MPRAAPLFPASATLRLDLAGFRIDIETNSLRLASRLQSYFAGFLAVRPHEPDVRLRAVVGEPSYDPARMQPWPRPAASSRAPKESWYDASSARYILKNRTGLVITLRVDEITVTGALDEHANQVVNLISTLFGLSLIERGCVMVHASAVVDPRSGRALVFLGNSGSGKSSLALQLVERGGFEFLSNDRVLMRVQGEGVAVFGLPQKPRVNPGTLLASDALSRLLPRSRRRIYERLPKEELWRIEEKTDVDVEREFGARTRLTAPLARVYSLEWRPGGEGLAQRALDAAGALRALEATAKDFGPYDRRGPSRDPAPEFRRIARRVPFIAVSGHADPRALAGVLLDACASDRSRASAD